MDVMPTCPASFCFEMNGESNVWTKSTLVRLGERGRSGRFSVRSSEFGIFVAVALPCNQDL